MGLSYRVRPEGYTPADREVLEQYLEYEDAANTLFDDIAEKAGKTSTTYNNSYMVNPDGSSVRAITEQFRPVKVIVLDREGEHQERRIRLEREIRRVEKPDVGTSTVRVHKMYVADPSTRRVVEKITRPSLVEWELGDGTAGGPAFGNPDEELAVASDITYAYEQDSYIGYLQRALGAFASVQPSGGSQGGSL